MNSVYDTTIINTQLKPRYVVKLQDCHWTDTAESNKPRFTDSPVFVKRSIDLSCVIVRKSTATKQFRIVPLMIFHIKFYGHMLTVHTENKLKIVSKLHVVF